MPFCPNCGHEVDVTARFCENCGQILPVLYKPSIPAPPPSVTERKVRRKRAPKITFILGLMTFIFGIVLVFAIPASVTWEPKSKVIADQETLTVSAGWASKSGVLADRKPLSILPLWQSKSESLIDKVLTVSMWSTYDYWFGSKPFILNEAESFMVVGTAIEQSSPQHMFNFYVFDSVNFDLWKADVAYTAYYEAQGKTSVSFSFSIATEVPDTLYFVVEGVQPVVRVTATISWIEKSSRYDYTEYHHSPGLFLIGEAKDFVVKGIATEAGYNKFNFYIMDSSNYNNWFDGKAYTAYYERKDISTVTFSVSLTKDQSTIPIYFVVENLNLDINETVSLSATISWVEQASIHTRSGYFTSLECTFEESKDFVLRGTAEEVGNNKFNFYIFDGDNYDNWADGKSYTSYYEVKNVTTTSFSIPLTEKQAESTTYFIAENPLLDISETVKVSATLEYEEKATIVATIGGFVIGSFIALIGFIIMIIAGIMAFIFRR